MRALQSRRGPLVRSSLLVAAAMVIALPAVAQSQRPSQPPPGPPPAMQQRPGSGGPGGPGSPGGPGGQMQMAPIKPYKPLAVTMPTPSNDPSFAAFRKQLADIAQRKDRAALARLVVMQGFFWDGENGNKADIKRPGIANLEQALGGFSGRDAQGWEALAAAAEDPTLEPLAEHNAVMCGPAGPVFDDKALEALTKATGTEAGDWAVPTTPNVEVRSAGQPNAPVIDKLGMNLVRVLPDQPPPGNAGPNMQPPMFARVVLPSGRTGYVSLESLSPIGMDQICYIKDASGWKITGYESAD